MRNIVLAAGFMLAVAVGAFAGLVRGYLIEVREVRPAPRSPQPPRRDPPPQPAPAVNRQPAPAPAPAAPRLPVLARVSRQPVSAAR